MATTERTENHRTGRFPRFLDSAVRPLDRGSPHRTAESTEPGKPCTFCAFCGFCGLVGVQVNQPQSAEKPQDSHGFLDSLVPRFVTARCAAWSDAASAPAACATIATP